MDRLFIIEYADCCIPLFMALNSVHLSKTCILRAKIGSLTCMPNCKVEEIYHVTTLAAF